METYFYRNMHVDLMSSFVFDTVVVLLEKMSSFLVFQMPQHEIKMIGLNNFPFPTIQVQGVV
ncbi:hypothetical protein HanIR_Chr01g0049431 [Helianthus annuus]|nr:hypothetical protein HanIR_Chr01g0049431 [Helianthus annuus]